MAIDFSKYVGSNAGLAAGRVDFSKYTGKTVAETQPPKSSFFGGIKTFLKGLTMLPKTVAASVLQATQGQKGASVTDKDWADRFIEKVGTQISQFTQETQEKYGEAKMLPGMPFKITDIAQLPQNLAYSITSMGAGLATGVPTALVPLPGMRVAAWVAGTAASGAAAYSATTYQIMQQYLEAKDEEKKIKTGQGLTREEEAALRDDFDEKARNYGLWEAVPEALSNLAFAKILTAPLIKIAGKSIATKIVGKMAGIYGEELLTETITQKGQAGIEVEAGLREGKLSWIEAFKEVAPQTFLLTTVMAGAGSAVVSISKAKQKIQTSLKNEIGEDNPLYQPILKAIDEGMKQTEVPKKEGISVISPEFQPLAQEARKYKSAEEFVKAQEIVYHGSPTPLKSFSDKKGGVFFTDSMEDASGFAGNPDNVYEGYLSFKNPLVIDAKGAKWDKLNTKWGKSTQEVISNAEKDGYDGVIFKNIVDNIMDTENVGGTSTISYAYKPKDVFLNESQLTDIYNQAVKGVERVAPKTIPIDTARVQEFESTLGQQEFEGSSRKEQAQLAEMYYKTDKQKLYDIATRKISNDKLTPTAAAKYLGKYGTPEEIADITTDPYAVSRAGQELSLTQTFDELNPVDRIKEVNAVLKEKASKERVSETKTKAKKAVENKNLSKETLSKKLSDYIDSITC
ncbi:MAG: hypothetical protein WC437_04620 [Patescibacteria group bacterium]